MRKLQEITALLCERMSDIHIPHIGQTDTRGEHRMSQGNPIKTTQQGIRIRTPGLNSQVPEITNSRRKHGKRARKAPMYKETVENTYSRVLYDPSLCQNEAEQETLRVFDIKRLIEVVLEQKQVMMVPKVTPPKGFCNTQEIIKESKVNYLGGKKGI